MGARAAIEMANEMAIIEEKAVIGLKFFAIENRRFSI
jgi:hypothetical protein